MISEPSESARPGLPLTATAEPSRMRVTWSPGLAPVSQASSIDPLPARVMVVPGAVLPAPVAAALATGGLRARQSAAVAAAAATTYPRDLKPMSHDASPVRNVATASLHRAFLPARGGRPTRASLGTAVHPRADGHTCRIVQRTATAMIIVRRRHGVSGSKPSGFPLGGALGSSRLCGRCLGRR